jgi:hypothetical protein
MVSEQSLARTNLRFDLEFYLTQWKAANTISAVFIFEAHWGLGIRLSVYHDPPHLLDPLCRKKNLRTI